MIMTVEPTTTLRSADTCDARLAPAADCNPRRLPTRVEAATPMPKGIVLRTIVLDKFSC